MNPISRWFVSANLPTKVFMGISVISAVVVVNKWVVAPYMVRQKYRRAEEWANMIIAQEEENEANAKGTNNVSY